MLIKTKMALQTHHENAETLRAFIASAPITLVAIAILVHKLRH